MQTLESLPQQQQDWFLTTPDGSLAARIQDGLTIGEDGDGELQFNPRKALVHFEKTDGGSLTLRVADDRLRFRTGVSGCSDTLTLTPWQSALLTLSSGTLAIYPEIGEEQTRENKVVVALTQQSMPAARAPSTRETPGLVVTESLPRVDTSEHASGQPAGSAQIIASTAPEDQLTASLVQSESGLFDRELPHADTDSRLDTPTMPMPIIRTGERALVETTGRPQRASSGFRLLILNVVALAVAGWWFWPSIWEAANEPDSPVAQNMIPATPATPPNAPSTGEASQGNDDLIESIARLAETANPEDQATQEFMVDTLETITTADPTDTGAADLLADLTARNDLAESTALTQPDADPNMPASVATELAATESTVPDQETPAVETPELPSAASLDSPSTAQTTDPTPTGTDALLNAELNRVNNLINRGNLISPIGDNAVQSLRNLRFRYPDSGPVLALIDRCTDALLSEASIAYESHRDFEARNILEEALSLNPNHEAANARWRQWVGSQPRP